MATHSRCLLLLSSLLACWVSPAWAGEPAPELLPDSMRVKHTARAASLPLNDWSRLQQIPTETELRVSVEGARVLRGKLVDVTHEELTLRVSSKELSTQPRTKVVRVHRARSDSLTNGTLIGLAIGAGFGALVGGFGIPTPITPLDEDKHGRGAFVASGLLIGGAAGAGLGALGDRSQKDFELVYEK